MGIRTELRNFLRPRGVRLPDRLLRDDEPFMRRVAQTLRPDDIVLDLGAHVGSASIEFSHECERVYAFEPHPELFKVLQKNTKRYRNIEPIEKAVSDTDGTAQLFFDQPNTKTGYFEGSTLVEMKTNLTYENAFTVQTVALGAFIESLDRDIALIKMDVEGAEYKILSALIETPAIHRIRKIYVEDHCDRVQGLAEERKAMEARLVELDLKVDIDLTWP